MPKRALDLDVFDGEPANRRSAYADLWRWANDRDRQFTVRGQQLALRRGQLAYSMLTLAERWRWSREKVLAVLTEFQNLGLITFVASKLTTIITVLDYDIYNPCTAPAEDEIPPASSNGSHNETNNTSSNENHNGPDNKTNTEGGREKEEGRRGNARASAPDPTGEGRIIPTDAEVSAFCASYQHGGLGISGIPEAWWSGWLAAQLSAARPFPHNWQRVLALQFHKDWLNANSPGYGVAHNLPGQLPSGGEKIAKNGATKSIGQQTYELDRAIREAEADIDEAFALNKPTKDLRARLGELQQQRAALPT